MTEAELTQRLLAYFAARMPDAERIRITRIERIYGGASRQTYALDLTYEQSGQRIERGLILRRDPPDSLIETDRRIEFAALQTVQGQASLPVPEALYLETDSDVLGAPFFIMTQIASGAPLNPFRLSEIDPLRERVGRQFFDHLGAIASVPLSGAPLCRERQIPEPDQCWKTELDYWVGEIRRNQRHPLPIIDAAIRHLYRKPPPPAEQVVLVHGDYRTGNFLLDETGEITAILDWEMAHLGDPLEDLAWATDPLWCSNDQERAAGFLPWSEAIDIWQSASGCRFDPEAFRWWSVFAHIKALAIWLTSARTFAEGDNDDPILAWSGWFTHAAHELFLAMRLGPEYGAGK